MNTAIIYKLVGKDWQLFKWYVLIYVVLGSLSAALMSLPYGLAYYSGMVALITVLIGASAHLAIHTVITEKKENQLTFLMGLPMDVMDYTLSKLVGNLFIYLVCWGAVMASTVAVILLTDLPNGFLPTALILGTEILLATTILLCIGILTGSEAITIITMVVLNLLFNLFMFSVVSLPDVGPHIPSETAVFNATVYKVLAAEVLAILALLCVTIYIRSRKACFF